ncbi:MAG: T9SS type A sorting domain-containing protein [Bacteroidetes bacterium]|nr:T9SS type A sorting domain-containing protein [Bacteroidota bacterium]
MNTQPISCNRKGLAFCASTVLLLFLLIGFDQNTSAQATQGIAQNPWSKLTSKLTHERRTFSPAQPLFRSKNQGVREHLHRNLGRTSAAANPDSVLMEDYLGGGLFEPTFNYRLVRNSAGKLTQARLWTPPSPPLPALPVGQAVMNYTAQGQLLQVSFFENLPTTVETFRLMQPVDSRGNCTSVRYMEDDGNGNLALMMGDSIAFTYMGNAVTGFVYRTYNVDSSQWEPSLRASAVTSAANGSPISFDLEFWDDLSGTWSPLKFRYSNLSWDLGFGSWMQSIGESYVVSAEDLIAPEGIMDLHRLSPSGPTEPTRFLVQMVTGPLLTPMFRRNSLSTGGVLQKFTDQEIDSANQWFSTTRTLLAWNAGVLGSITVQDSTSGSWVNDIRDSRTYTSNGDLQVQKNEEFVSGQGWTTNSGSEALITYNPSNASRITSWIRKEYDSFAGAWDSVARYTLFYNTVSSTCPTCLTSDRWSVYPNPIAHQFEVQGLTAGAQLRVTDACGRQMHLGGVAEGDASLRVDCSTWAPGWYLLQQIEADGRVSVYRLLKP